MLFSFNRINNQFQSFRKYFNHSHSRKIKKVSSIAITLVSIGFTLGVLADESSNRLSSKMQLSSNDSKVVVDTNVGIKTKPMTRSMKLENAASNELGAFSMKDGAREGYYGDGQYIDED